MITTHAAGRRAINHATRTRFRRHLKPIPKLTMSQWASRYRVINGAPWLNDTAPYLAVVMDAISDPLVQEVVFVAPSQSGKSEIALNVIGYYSHQEPSPVLLVQPTVEMGESFSKDRFAGMLRETPVLGRLFGEARSRESSNTILSKQCPGGGVDIAGANAPAGLAMRPKRIVILDERDRHPRSAGAEGDVKAIARARTRRWRHRRKVVEISSPTDEETSLIFPSYLEGTREVLHIECLECGAPQVPALAQLKWTLTDGGQVDPASVAYECVACLHRMPAALERVVKQRARFIATAAPRVPHKRTFRVHGLLAAFHAWVEIAQEFVTANGQKDLSLRADMLRAFFNTTLGELYKDVSIETAKSKLLARATRYDGGKREDPIRFHVPRDAGIIVSGVDLQHDFARIIVRAFGVGETSWLIERTTLRGDTSQPAFWAAFEDYRLTRSWTHESGAPMQIRAMCIDAGDGTHAKKVYEYCAPRLAQHVFAIKGHGQITAPMIPNKHTKVKPGRLYLLGVNAIMERLNRRLGMVEPGPGFLHLNTYADEDYVTQVLSMKRVRDEKERKYRWVATPGIRNEDADAEGYAYAALLLGPVPLVSLAEEVARVNAEGAAILARGDAPEPPPAPTTAAPANTWIRRDAVPWMGRRR